MKEYVSSFIHLIILLKNRISVHTQLQLKLPMYSTTIQILCLSLTKDSFRFLNIIDL
jgi:hypothetical protein